MENENISNSDNIGAQGTNVPGADTGAVADTNATTGQNIVANNGEQNVADNNVNNVNTDTAIQEQQEEARPNKSAIADALASAVKKSDDNTDEREEKKEEEQQGLDDGPHIHKVLIIEDNEAERTSLRAALETESIVVEAVENGFEAENTVRVSMFDIAIVDYRLPDIDGLNLIKKLKISIPELMPLVVTAHSSVEIAVESLKMGAYDYMTKPLNIPNLIKTISTMIQDKETAISSRKKLVDLQSKQGIKYTASSADEQVSIITTPNPDMLVSAETKLSFSKKVKKFILAVKNFYWGS